MRRQPLDMCPTANSGPRLDLKNRHGLTLATSTRIDNMFYRLRSGALPGDRPRSSRACYVNEIALSSGWGAAYVRLADELDELYTGPATPRPATQAEAVTLGEIVPVRPWAAPNQVACLLAHSRGEVWSSPLHMDVAVSRTRGLSLSLVCDTAWAWILS